jgi:hypothetical protein
MDLLPLNNWELEKPAGYVTTMTTRQVDILIVSQLSFSDIVRPSWNSVPQQQHLRQKSGLGPDAGRGGVGEG